MNAIIARLKALFEQYKPLLLLLAKSRTMQGIAAAAIGMVINYAQKHFPQPVLDLCGEYIPYAAASLQAAGLGWAVRGRWLASGPINPQSAIRDPQSFDGTGGELPK
jgi:hypothetical protein